MIPAPVARLLHTLAGLAPDGATARVPVPALPGLEDDASLVDQAVALYRPLYGADADSARVGVETMCDVYGSAQAALAELIRRAGQAGDIFVTDQHQDRAS